VTHGAPVSPEIDLEPLRKILSERFNADHYQDALELIVGASQEAQHLYGYVPQDAAKLIADHLGVSVNRIYGLLTFYADFLTEPPGDHVMLLCHGSACYVSGSQRLVDRLDEHYNVASGGTTPDGSMTVQIVNGCLGVCDLAPVIQVDHEQYYGRLDVEQFEKILEDFRRTGNPEETDGAPE
jgi:NADH-quinone oxidoreductase subunit E